MNSSIFRFTLGMNSSQSQISIPVLLGDTGREWHINLSDGGNSYIIADGCLAKLTIKRPTGTRLEEFCAIVDHTTMVYKFSQNENTAAVEGFHDCDLSLYGLDGKFITSARFSMIVSERVLRRDDIVLTDEDFTLSDAMAVEEAKRQASESQRANAESERIREEEARAMEENERNASEAERVSAEETRATNESGRKTAESLRVANESTRASNEEVRVANEAERVSKDARRDASINKAVADSAEALSKANNVTAEVGVFRTEHSTMKTSVNSALVTAGDAKAQSDVTRTNLINLSAQVQGIGRSYVVPDFSYFIDFLNSARTIELREDRNGDGVEETYIVSISDLKTGDNIIIAEKGVPDFWFEKNSALTSFESYTHNKTEYTLAVRVNGAVIGGAHILETDYTVIEGYATSASASANNAKASETKAKEAEANIDTMVDELFFDQIAPPFDDIENSVFLITPTFEML